MSNKYFPKNLYIESVKQFLVPVLSRRNNTDIAQEDEYLKPLNQVNLYYNRQKLIFRKTSENTTSLDQSLTICNQFEEHYDYFIYSQNTPDYKSLNSPLSPILEQSKIQYNNILGITHLDYVSGLESLRLIDFTITDKSLLIITENCIDVHKNTFGHLLGDSSVGISLNRNSGMQVKCIMSKVTQNNGEIKREAFLEEVNRFYSEFFKDAPSKYIIVQNSIPLDKLHFREFSYVRSFDKGVDYLSNDVWVTFNDLLNKKSLSDCMVTLISTDFKHRVCFCNVQIG